MCKSQNNPHRGTTTSKPKGTYMIVCMAVVRDTQPAHTLARTKVPTGKKIYRSHQQHPHEGRKSIKQHPVEFLPTFTHRQGIHPSAQCLTFLDIFHEIQITGLTIIIIVLYRSSSASPCCLSDSIPSSKLFAEKIPTIH